MEVIYRPQGNHFICFPYFLIVALISYRLYHVGVLCEHLNQNRKRHQGFNDGSVADMQCGIEIWVVPIFRESNCIHITFVIEKGRRLIKLFKQKKIRTVAYILIDVYIQRGNLLDFDSWTTGFHMKYKSIWDPSVRSLGQTLKQTKVYKKQVDSRNARSKHTEENIIQIGKLLKLRIMKDKANAKRERIAFDRIQFKWKKG